MLYIHCPNCLSPKIKKNDHTHHGKQNHKCKDCGRQFVLQNDHSIGALIRSLICAIYCQTSMCKDNGLAAYPIL